MDAMQSVQPEADESSIIDILEDFVFENGWNCKRGAETVLLFERWVKPYRFDFVVAERDDGGTLIVFANFNFDLPDGMRQPPKRLYELLNLLNSGNEDIGKYWYDAKEGVVVWKYEMILSFENEVDMDQLEQILDRALAEISRRRLAFVYVVKRGSKAKDAFELLIPEDQKFS
jgi:hypothetical protein